MSQMRLSTFNFSIGDIIKFIKALDPNKAHGHDGISIKVCALSISKSLHILLKTISKVNVSPMFLLTRKK